jgi:hypothetical protein
VLTFLTPTLTGVVSHFLLKEPFSRKQALAGCTSLSLGEGIANHLALFTVCSLSGVILIARPASLFGHDDKDDPAAEVNSAQRLTAVG